MYVYMYNYMYVGGCSSNGLSADELSASLATVQSLALACAADVKVLRKRQAELGDILECLIRRRVDENDFLEVRYVCVMFYYVACAFCIQANSDW